QRGRFCTGVRNCRGYGCGGCSAVHDQHRGSREDHLQPDPRGNGWNCSRLAGCRFRNDHSARCLCKVLRMTKPTRQQLLLVDDEEDANEELAELLEGEGFRCFTASSVKL